MQILADLQLHSKYSRAVSPQMVIPEMYQWSLKKGIQLLATGDWTHPLWNRELKANLEEMGNGLLKLKPNIKSQIQSNLQHTEANDPLFLLSGEVSCIYSHNGKVRRNHILLLAPSFTIVDKINDQLTKRGCNLSSDGRPILGLTSQQICQLVWEISDEVLIIPAHAWTPWFSLYGSMSGYDSLTECFGEYADRIYAIETGLSSDPAMNWRIRELDRRTLISCSDAHSGAKLMREATIYNIPSGFKLSFSAISEAIKNYQRLTDRPHIAATVEFFPEEGKYHYSGHKNCQIRWSPEEVKKNGTICPVCGKSITIGVANRVEQLASITEAELKLLRKPLGNLSISATYSSQFTNRAPYIMLVPLMEILVEATGVNSATKSILAQYDLLISHFGSEFNVLVKTSTQAVAKLAGDRVAEGINRVRNRDIVIIPGFDGVFGTVKIWGQPENLPVKTKKQLSLFS